MYYSEENQEETKSEDRTCPLCGLRQYGNVCANCNEPFEDEEEDLDKKKEDEWDEYDWRERR